MRENNQSGRTIVLRANQGGIPAQAEPQKGHRGYLTAPKTSPRHDQTLRNGPHPLVPTSPGDLSPEPHPHGTPPSPPQLPRQAHTRTHSAGEGHEHYHWT